MQAWCQQVGDLEVSYWKEISHATVSITYAQRQKTNSLSLLNEMNISEKPNQAECQLYKPIIDILRSGGAYQTVTTNLFEVWVVVLTMSP